MSNSRDSETLLNVGWRQRWPGALLTAGFVVVVAAISCSNTVPNGEPIVVAQAQALQISEGDKGLPATIPSTPYNAQPAAGNSTRRPLIPAPGDVPTLDTSVNSVPLSDIVFDTFGGSSRYLPLDEASESRILDPRDAIVPIDEPVYGGVDALSWLEDDSLVIGYVSGSDAYAYPISVLDRHEIVNDEIGGVPVLVTYCPLCFSGAVYSRKLGGSVLTFGNTSAIYQSDLVMYDHQTGSYWFQVAGEAVVGVLTGSRLKLLPSSTMAWGEWKLLHPQTRLLTGRAGSPIAFDKSIYARAFGHGYPEEINKGRFIFPVDEAKLDRRLLAGEVVLTAEVGEQAVAFPLARIGDSAVNHHVGSGPVVVFARAQEWAVGAFSPLAEGETLTFDYREKDQRFVDRETGSV